MKRLLTALTLLITASTAYSQQSDKQVEVRELLTENKSTLVFTPNEDLTEKNYPLLFSRIQKDHSFIEALEMEDATNTVYVHCHRNISLAEVSLLLREFNVTVYHYSPEIEIASK